MLPPGIFIWESGMDGIASRTDVEAIARTHASWATDMARCMPWETVETHTPCGRLRRSDTAFPVSVVVVEETTTTMEAATVLCDAGMLSEWGVVMAVRQTSGRGQLRRHWVSPPGNLHMSIVLPRTPKEGAWAEMLPNLLPLLCGYVFCQAFEEVGAQLELKWPNDLLQEGRKVGGMLVEERGGRIILGMGINLVDSPSDSMMREDSSVSAGVIRMTQNATALRVGSELVKCGKSIYKILLDKLTPENFVSVLTERLAWMGRTVSVREGAAESYNALVLGVSPEGGLILLRGGKESILLSGSIRPL